MKRILWVVFIIVVISVPAANIFSADYFLFDKENNKILFMGARDTQFTEKIDMEKNPDRLMPTDDPDKYLAIFAPEVKRGKEKDAQKGQLILFNIASGRTEDLIELGYSPFNWVYTQDRRHLFISYRPDLTSGYYEILHYNIPEKTTEKLPDYSKKLDDLVLSYDETRLYTLIPGDEKEPGKVEVLSYGPLAVAATIPTDVNPWNLFVLSADKFAVIDADEQNRKKTGAIKIYNTSDNTIAEDFKLDPPYKLYSHWYKDDQTLIMVSDTRRKSYALKVSAAGIAMNEIPRAWMKFKYVKEMDSLLLYTKNQLVMIDYVQGVIQACNTGTLTNFYDIEEVPEMKMVVLFTSQGGNVKFIDIQDKIKMVKNASCGRASAKFGNFMANLIVNSVLTYGSYSYSSGYYYRNYYVYNANLFRSGNAVAASPDNAKFYILRRDTRDITVFHSNFDKPAFIVPSEPPITMYQIKKPNSRTLVVSGKKIFQLNDADDSLSPVYEFQQPVSDCFFFGEENRLIILTNRNLLVLDPDSLAVKNDMLFFGNPDEKYTRLKKGEMRYNIIPAM
jgi:hypothetical protein